MAPAPYGSCWQWHRESSLSRHLCPPHTTSLPRLRPLQALSPSRTAEHWATLRGIALHRCPVPCWGGGCLGTGGSSGWEVARSLVLTLPLVFLPWAMREHLATLDAVRAAQGSTVKWRSVWESPVPAALAMLLRVGRLCEMLLSVSSCLSMGLGVAVWWGMGL